MMLTEYIYGFQAGNLLDSSVMKLFQPYNIKRLNASQNFLGINKSKFCLI